jgi:hypothetical protein
MYCVDGITTGARLYLARPDWPLQPTAVRGRRERVEFLDRRPRLSAVALGRPES